MCSSALRLMLAALTVVMVVVSTATAQDKSICAKAWGVRAAVVKKHGKRAPGRNICRQGVRIRAHTRGVNAERAFVTRPATTNEKRHYLRALRRLNSPAPALLVRTAGMPRVPPAGTMSAHIAAGSTLSAIANCESHGNPRAISPGGKYRGKYQFDYGTWGSVGGTGDPAAASEEEQDYRAALLYQRSGSAPWPVCGR